VADEGSPVETCEFFSVLECEENCMEGVGFDGSEKKIDKVFTLILNDSPDQNDSESKDHQEPERVFTNSA
jgi:hypothetical protein